jgi:hypothetical protein
MKIYVWTAVHAGRFQHLLSDACSRQYQGSRLNTARPPPSTSYPAHQSSPPEHVLDVRDIPNNPHINLHAIELSNLPNVYSWTLVNDHNTLSVCEVHDLLWVRIMRSSICISSDPLYQIVVACNKWEIVALTSDL